MAFSEFAWEPIWNRRVPVSDASDFNRSGMGLAVLTTCSLKAGDVPTPTLPLVVTDPTLSAALDDTSAPVMVPSAMSVLFTHPLQTTSLAHPLQTARIGPGLTKQRAVAKNAVRMPFRVM